MIATPVPVTNPLTDIAPDWVCDSPKPAKPKRKARPFKRPRVPISRTCGHIQLVVNQRSYVIQKIVVGQIYRGAARTGFMGRQWKTVQRFPHSKRFDWQEWHAACAAMKRRQLDDGLVPRTRGFGIAEVEWAKVT